MPMKIRLVTVAGNVDMDWPPLSEFGAFVTSIRANGYFCSPEMYVPYTSILAMFIYDTEKQGMPITPAEPRGTLQ
jgi:hypothetical protein